MSNTSGKFLPLTATLSAHGVSLEDFFKDWLLSGAAPTPVIFANSIYVERADFLRWIDRARGDGYAARASVPTIKEMRRADDDLFA